MSKLISILFFHFFVIAAHGQDWIKQTDEVVNWSLQRAASQYQLLDHILPDSSFPRAVDSTGKLVTNRSTWWTSGFFPGSLWYLYEYSGDPILKEIAMRRSKSVEKEKLNISDHDIGFKIYCPFGNAFRITGDTTFIPVIVTAASSLSKRFDPRVGLIRSWGKINDEKEFIVIIDNMMNLELLFAATRLTGDSSYYKIARAQADKTIQEHFRPDGSSYHLVVYDPATGSVIKKRTAQGAADTSAWARGQAWGLYGYTVCYRETRDKKYLDQARTIARFILNHPNLPADKIPYWDFNAAGIPDANRDASAAAIISAALMELANYTSSNESKLYRHNAALIIRNLSDTTYRTRTGEKYNFLLKHSVGHLPARSEVDTPLSYADYYYIEAMLRWKHYRAGR